VRAPRPNHGRPTLGRSGRPGVRAAAGVGQPLPGGRSGRRCLPAVHAA
jgi:hypothetical protein